MSKQAPIHVGLYGDGSRDSRLRAERIYCDMADQCSAYKAGKCFMVTTLFGSECGVGHVIKVDGGTKRSKAFLRVRKEAFSDPAYNKLKYPHGTRVTKIGDKALITMPYIEFEKLDRGKLGWHEPGFGKRAILIDASNLSVENIYTICSATPVSMTGERIGEYQTRVVPRFLHELRELFPYEYRAFLEKHPVYVDIPRDFAGQRARLATCNREGEFKDTNGNRFRFDGDAIVCNEYKSAFLPFGAKVATIRIPVTEDLVVNITDNDQVTLGTKFE